MHRFLLESIEVWLICCDLNGTNTMRRMQIDSTHNFRTIKTKIWIFFLWNKRKAIGEFGWIYSISGFFFKHSTQFLWWIKNKPILNRVRLFLPQPIVEITSKMPFTHTHTIIKIMHANNFALKNRENHLVWFTQQTAGRKDKNPFLTSVHRCPLFAFLTSTDSHTLVISTFVTLVCILHPNKWKSRNLFQLCVVLLFLASMFSARISLIMKEFPTRLHAFQLNSNHSTLPAR